MGILWLMKLIRSINIKISCCYFLCYVLWLCYDTHPYLRPLCCPAEKTVFFWDKIIGAVYWWLNIPQVENTRFNWMWTTFSKHCATLKDPVEILQTCENVAQEAHEHHVRKTGYCYRHLEKMVFFSINNSMKQMSDVAVLTIAVYVHFLFVCILLYGVVYNWVGCNAGKQKCYDFILGFFILGLNVIILCLMLPGYIYIHTDTTSMCYNRLQFLPELYVAIYSVFLEMYTTKGVIYVVNAWFWGILNLIKYAPVVEYVVALVIFLRS